MAEALVLDQPLPLGNASRHNTGLWGVWSLIVTEASLFGYLILSYAYLNLTGHNAWPPDGPPKLLLPGLNTALLAASSVFVGLAERNLKRSRTGLALVFLAVAIALGVVFLGVQAHEWAGKSYTPASHLYGSLYFVITGFHMAHVAVGVLVLAVLWLWIALRRVRAGRHAPLTIGGLYWHFVDVVWLVIFTVLYLEPHLHG